MEVTWFRIANFQDVSSQTPSVLRFLMYITYKKHLPLTRMFSDVSRGRFRTPVQDVSGRQYGNSNEREAFAHSYPTKGRGATRREFWIFLLSSTGVFAALKLQRTRRVRKPPAWKGGLAFRANSFF